jgi:N-acetylneuraminic acid mutarotase
MAKPLSMLSRVHHTATLVNTTEGAPVVVVAGGVGMSPGSPRAVDVFDLTTETWRRGPKLLGGRYRHRALVDARGRVVVVGGEIRRGIRDPEAAVPIAEGLDEDHAAWRALSDPPTVMALPPPPRLGAALCTLRDGRMLAAGGVQGSDFSRAVEACDPSDTVWRPLGSLRVARAHAAVVELPDGTALVLGGHAHDGAEDRLISVIERIPTTGR